MKVEKLPFRSDCPTSCKKPNLFSVLSTPSREQPCQLLPTSKRATLSAQESPWFPESIIRVDDLGCNLDARMASPAASSLQLSLAALAPPDSSVEKGHAAMCKAVRCTEGVEPAAQAPGKENEEQPGNLPAPEAQGLPAPEAQGQPAQEGGQQQEAPGLAEIESGCSTLPGARYGTLNQDVVLVEQLGTPDEAGQRCLAVVLLDGHGMLGEEAASRGGAAMMAFLRGSALSQRPLCTLSPQEVSALLEVRLARQACCGGGGASGRCGS